MADRIAQHFFSEGKCVHCERPESEKEHSCVYRDPPPRAVPVSIFSDLGAIGDRMKEIQAQEAR